MSCSKSKNQREDFNRPNPFSVLEVIDALLGPNGCPWDKQQTPESLCEYLVEEVFELVEAIKEKDKAEIEEEMGDVFFLLFFILKLLQREFSIDLQTIWEKNALKMKKRHPHVFGDIKIDSKEELYKKWTEVKIKEEGKKEEEFFNSIPKALPPLTKAYRINAKASQIGFTWQDNESQERSLLEEWREWEKVKDSKDQEKKEEEFGDLLFSLVEHGRRHGVKANVALDKANRKFLKRFSKMIELIKAEGKDWSLLSMEEKDKFWQKEKEMKRSG